MNYLDIIMILPVLWLAFKGLKKGLVKEIASLAALFLGIWLASSFSNFLADMLMENTKINESYIPIIAFATIFIIVVILVHMLSAAMDKLVNAIALQSVNKIGGAAFGVAKAVLILGALIFVTNEFLVVKLEIIPQDIVESSLFYQPMLDLIEYVYPKIESIKFNQLPIS